MAANQPQAVIKVDVEGRSRIEAYKEQIIKPARRVNNELKEWLEKIASHDQQAMQWPAIMKFLPNAAFLSAYSTAGEDETIALLTARECLCELVRLYLTIRNYRCDETVILPISREQFIAAFIVVQGKYSGAKIGIPTFHLELDLPSNFAYGGLKLYDIWKLWHSGEKACILILVDGECHQSLVVVDLECKAIIHFDSLRKTNDERSTLVFKHVREVFRDSGYPHTFEELTPTVTQQDRPRYEMSGPCVILIAHAWARYRQHGAAYWRRCYMHHPTLAFTDWKYHMDLRSSGSKAKTFSFEVAWKTLEDGYSSLLGYVPLLSSFEADEPIPLSRRRLPKPADQGGGPQDPIVLEDPIALEDPIEDPILLEDLTEDPILLEDLTEDPILLEDPIVIKHDEDDIITEHAVKEEEEEEDFPMSVI